jgi:hypothetical protein
MFSSTRGRQHQLKAVRKFRSSPLLFAGAATLLLMVGLMSFGERARQFHYHIDGGRGWDLPPSLSFDTGHAQVHIVVEPATSVMFEHHEVLVSILVLRLKAPVPKSASLGTWYRLRPPPQA